MLIRCILLHIVFAWTVKASDRRCFSIDPFDKGPEHYYDTSSSPSDSFSQYKPGESSKSTPSQRTSKGVNNESSSSLPENNYYESELLTYLEHPTNDQSLVPGTTSDGSDYDWESEINQHLAHEEYLEREDKSPELELNIEEGLYANEEEQDGAALSLEEEDQMGGSGQVQWANDNEDLFSQQEYLEWCKEKQGSGKSDPTMRQYYHRKYMQRIEEKTTAYWTQLVRQRKNEAHRLVRLLAQLTGLNKSTTRVHLALNLTQEIHKKLLSNKAVERDWAVHMLDYGLDDQIFTITERQSLMRDYLRTPTGKPYKNNAVILKYGLRRLTPEAKREMKNTWPKTPKDYERFAATLSDKWREEKREIKKRAKRDKGHQ